MRSFGRKRICGFMIPADRDQLQYGFGEEGSQRWSGESLVEARHQMATPGNGGGRRKPGHTDDTRVPGNARPR